jgi:hypothetical protein
MPGIAKIGATTRDRLREANESDTWRPPEPYVVACAARVTDGRENAPCEASRAAGSAHREFFRLTVNETRLDTVTRCSFEPHLEYPQRKKRTKIRASFLYVSMRSAHVGPITSPVTSAVLCFSSIAVAPVYMSCVVSAFVMFHPRMF